jgi:hypothetical protein
LRWSVVFVQAGSALTGGWRISHDQTRKGRTSQNVQGRTSMKRQLIAALAVTAALALTLTKSGMIKF